MMLRLASSRANWRRGKCFHMVVADAGLMIPQPHEVHCGGPRIYSYRRDVDHRAQDSQAVK
jgi:hypothetical protein